MFEPLIQAQAIGRTYQQGDTDLAAVVSASFQIQAQDRIALVGRSGCGKSTLIHLMAGLDKPTIGTLNWPAFGAPDTLLPEQIALVFQAPSLLDPLTVAENVALPLLMSGKTADIDQAVAAALATFQLSHLANKLPETLSGGQMQCVAMARAIAGQPRLILADEPTGQLDRATGRALLDALLTHLAHTDTALLIATHDSIVAERMKTVWQMEHGTLLDTAQQRNTA